MVEFRDGGEAGELTQRPIEPREFAHDQAVAAPGGRSLISSSSNRRPLPSSAPTTRSTRPSSSSSPPTPEVSSAFLVDFDAVRGTPAARSSCF